VSITETARRLAHEHPDARLPCPHCAAGLRATNLERHLDKVHPAAPVGRADARSWSGADRLVARPLVVVPVLVAAAAFGLAVAGGGPEQPLLLGAAVLLAVGLLLAAIATTDLGLFRSRLSVADGALRLRHSFGLGHRRVSPAERVEIGSAYLRESTSSGGDGYQGSDYVEFGAGAYLRVHGNGRSITVRCRNGGELRKCWVGWEKGRRARRWDITLATPDFVELQYALTEISPLNLRIV
jgi:hypothetical protein